LHCSIAGAAVIVSALAVEKAPGKTLARFPVHRCGMFRIALLLACLAPSTGFARPPPRVAAPIPPPAALCRDAVLQAERAGHIPERLMDAIAMVESGRRDPVSGAVYPWPWTINAEGVGHWYDSKAEAIAAVKALQARGVASIDVGCMQVNLMHHPTAFASLDIAFDPAANATYAARFLRDLYNQTYAWPLAAAAYHSFTPDIGADYARKVLAAWGQPQAPSGAAMVAQAASPAAAPPMAGGRVAVMLPMGNEAIRVMPLPSPGPSTAVTGRGLDAYRAMPIMISARMPRPG
jgi:hypothetical protein